MSVDLPRAFRVHPRLQQKQVTRVLLSPERLFSPRNGSVPMPVPGHAGAVGGRYDMTDPHTGWFSGFRHRVHRHEPLGIATIGVSEREGHLVRCVWDKVDDAPGEKPAALDEVLRRHRPGDLDGTTEAPAATRASFRLR